MVLTKDGKALTFNGKLLKSNSDLIKVDELPSENIKEGIIYKSAEPQELREGSFRYERNL